MRAITITNRFGVRAKGCALWVFVSQRICSVLSRLSLKTTESRNFPD